MKYWVLGVCIIAIYFFVLGYSQGKLKSTPYIIKRTIFVDKSGNRVPSIINNYCVKEEL